MRGVSVEGLTSPSLSSNNVHCRVRSRRLMQVDLKAIQLLDQLEEFALRRGGRFLNLLRVSFLELFPELDSEGRERAARILELGRGSTRMPLFGGTVADAIVSSNPLRSGSIDCGE